MMAPMRISIASLLVLLGGCAGGGNNQGTVDMAQAASGDLAQASGGDLATGGGDMAAIIVVGATVQMKDDFYMPNMVTINAGQAVKWTWAAAGAHGVNSVDDAFPDSAIINAGNTSYQVQFKNPGTYPVNCLVHGAAMPMTITVK